MVADVPIKGVNTIYATVGDLLGWLCVFGLLGLILLAIVLSIRKKRKLAVNHVAELPSTSLK
jgi:apolipoprotein N-acyltransferase